MIGQTEKKWRFLKLNLIHWFVSNTGHTLLVENLTIIKGMFDFQCCSAFSYIPGLGQVGYSSNSHGSDGCDQFEDGHCDL